MALFSEQFIQQVTQATDVVELIGQYVALTKKGREFVGLCPFHDDHSPSMRVSPVKQIFKCFSCGAGGGAAKFLMDYEKMSFPEALRRLAEQANIAVPVEVEQHAPAVDGVSKDLMLRLMKFAVEFFRRRLVGEAGKAALDYAHSRGLTDESIERFSLGLAVESWDDLYRAARAKGVGESVLTASGLAIQRDQGQGCYDRFRNRLMFPIFDMTGKPVAFGGRALAADEQAKYINSPETPLFDKSGMLYGLNWARDAIRTTGRAVVVEGYLDTVIPMQAGVEGVVATMGTALTDRHVRTLSRFASEAVLVFDADVAGSAAAERALEVFISQRVSVRVATIPSGKDPADYVLAEGAEAFNKLIDDAPDAMQYVLDRRMADYEAAGGNLADRGRIIEDFLQLIVSSTTYGAIDEVRRGQLAQHVAHILNVSAADLQQQMRRLGRRLPSRPTAGSQRPRREVTATNRPLAERHVIEVLVNDTELFDRAAERIDPDDFTDPDLQEIARHVWRLGQSGHLHLDELLATEEMIDFGPLLTDLATTGDQRENYEPTLTGAVDDIVRRRDQAEAERLRATGNDDEALRKLTDHYRQGDMRRRPKIS